MAISERLHVVKRSFSEPTPLRHFFDNESLALVMFDFYLAHFDVMAKLDKIAARYGELINKNSSEQYQAEINALQTQFKTLLMPVWFPFKCAQLPSEVFQEEILMRSCQQLNFSLLLSDVLSCQEQPTFSNYPRGFSNQVDARRRMNAALKLSPSEQVLHWYARHGQKLDQALRVSSVVMLGLLLMTIISGVGFAVMFAASAIFAAVGLGMMIAYGVSRFRVHREPNAHIESKQHFDERPESEQDVLSESTLLMMRALPSTRPPQPVALVVEQSPAAAPEVITEMLVMPEAPVFTP